MTFDADYDPTSISLSVICPNLLEIGGDFFAGDSNEPMINLETLDLSGVTSIGGTFHFEGTSGGSTALASLTFGPGTTIGYDLIIQKERKRVG